MSDFFRVIFSQRVVSAVLIFLAFLISILMLLLPSQRGVSGLNSPVEGQVIPQMVYAAVDFRTIDWKAQTEPQRQDYLLQKHRSESIRTAVAGYCSELGDKLKGPHHAEAEKLGKLLLNPENWKRFSTRFEGEVLNSGILPAEVQKTACKLYVIPEGDGTLVYGPKQYDSMTQERAAEKTAALLCDLFYVGNGKTAFQTALAKELLPCFEDGNLQIRISEEQNIVRPEQVIYAGTLLLKKGERLTKEDITLLEDHRKALEERKAEQNSSLNKIQKILLAALFMVFTSLYLRAVYPKIMHRQQLGLVISFVTLLALIANLLAGTFFRHVSNETNILQSLIFLSLPLAFPSLLLSTVFGLRSGISVGLYIAGITAIYLDQSFPVLLTGLLISGIAGSFVRNCRDYKKFFMTGLVTVTLTTFICGATFLLNVCDDMACLPHLRDVAILSFGTGMVTPLLALLVLFLMETCFDVSSTMSYLGFTDRNHKLLTRLKNEAAGTYHHSEQVATIAENAAPLIGANPLLVQACALFHDIGKLDQSGLFTENADGENPHKDMKPWDSAGIIRNHVTHGVELAKKYRLKSPLLHAIERHHGTDHISFFYDKARQEYPDVTLNEDDFRYNGPLPDDKETALVMLADCTEAWARSFSAKQKLTREILEEKVADLFNRKLENGQLDQAPLTFQELKAIRESFVTTLLSMNHNRIQYPDDTEKE